MKHFRDQLRIIRTNVMHLMTVVAELEQNVANDPAVTPTIKKADRGAGGRFVKKS